MLTRQAAQALAFVAASSSLEERFEAKRRLTGLRLQADIPASRYWRGAGDPAGSDRNAGRHQRNRLATRGREIWHSVRVCRVVA
jgi:hypothetical protein